MTIKAYRTYVFVDKDPIIDVVRTAIADTGRSEYQISKESGVSGGAFRGWFRGETRRPSYAAIMATLHACGKTLVVADEAKVTRRRVKPRFKVVAGK